MMRLAFAILLAGCAFAATNEKFRNEKVAVFESTLAPGERETLPGRFPAVTVYSQPGTLEVTAGGKAAKISVKAGEAHFAAASPTGIRNTGASPLHSIRIEFLASGSAETWGKTGLAPHYELLLENRYTRVYDIRIPAHTNEPQHTHHDRVVICLSGAKLSHLYPDGHEEPSTLTTGETVWRKGGTHIGQNLGDTDLWVIAVEPK